MSSRAIGHAASDYHMITTTHPYMVELGLGSFTMESLYNWWNERSSDGTYLHRLCINNNRADLEEPENKLPQLLGISGGTEFFWYGWKPNRDIPNAGVYKRFDFSTFEGNGGGNSPWAFYSAAVRDTVTVDDTLLGQMGDHREPVVGGKVDALGDFRPTTSSSLANPVHERDVLEGLSPIYHLTNFNRYMSAFYSFFPRSTWEEAELLGPTIGGIDTKKLFASHELLVDIKASKMGQYIEWSGEVTFFINEGVLCAGGITEWIPFKLYLFDGANAVSNKTVTLKSIKLTGPAKDVTGKLYKSSEDGERISYDPKDPASQKVGDLEVSMNSVTKKWESGSPALFAMMETDLGKAITPDIGGLQTSNIQLALNSEEYTYSKFIPTTGIAMPIRPQNGNPHQWQPNYLKPKEVRCETGEDTKKETLTVYNFSSQSNFRKGDSVMLTRIDGVWHVSAIGPKADDELANVETSVGTWGEFTYMMTNSEYFFRTAAGNTFTPRDAEQYFHFLYHKGDSLNAGVAGTVGHIGVDYGTDGGWDSDQPFNTKSVSNVELKHGYAQTTSFDYLDSQIFGIRKKNGMYATGLEDKCSIATTSALRTAAGKIIPSPVQDYSSRNAAHAGVFFGCLFPGGYTGASTYFAPRDWNIDAKSSGDMVNTDFYLDTFTSWPNYGKYPFDAGAEGTADFRTGHRNNCRQPARSDPFEDISEGGNIWSRADGRASANLFSEDTNGTNLTQFFRSIPADVMTNASPTGKNGSPLYPVHRFKDFHNPLALDDTKLLADQAFLYGVWLGKTPLSGDLEDPDESAFDFKPVSRNTLMFRPLKMEAYIQFGEKQNAAGGAAAKNLDKGYARGSRIGFSSEARRTQIDWNRPATGFFENREKSKADGGFWNDYGMKWGKEIEGKPRYGNLHDFNYWNDSYGPMQWTLSSPHTNGPGNWRGAGAFGVIATFTTVTANSQIDIATDNLYGMGAAAHGTFSLAGGYQNQDKTWGVPSLVESYKQANVIDLSVRIYQQHPRDQTLFDPRTFAVHHFNPDVRLRDGYFLEANGGRTKLDPFRLFEKEIQRMNLTTGPIKVWYKSYKERSVVDLRVISRYEKEIDFNAGFSAADLHAATETYSAIPLLAGEYVLADATLSSAGGRQTPLIASSLWTINDVRVGKLLPFRYHTLELGIPTPEDVEFFVNDGTYSLLNTGLQAFTQDIKDTMIIKNLGAGYKIGDIVGLSSREVRFKVTLVETRDAPNANPPLIKGRILALQCKSHGKGITASETAPYGKVFDANSEGLLKITTLGSDDGKDFDAYFVAAKVYKEVHTDPKPYLMKRDGEEIVRVASSNGQGTHLTTGPTQTAEQGAFIDESSETTFVLDPTLYSATKEYDIFFHFHNDISMTWLAGGEDFHGDNVHNRSEASEQHITVKINPR